MKRKILSLFMVVIMMMSSLTTIAFGADEGTVLYDKDGVKITYQNYKIDDYGYFKVKLLIENNSSKGICVQARKESINGVMIDSIISENVQTGKKANGEMRFSNNSLEENYISEIYDIEFSFSIFEEDSWDAIDESPIVKLSFDGVSLNNGISADTRPITTLYDKGGIRVSYINYSFNYYGDLDVDFLIENNSSKYIAVQARKESINGFMVKSIMSTDLQAGKKAYAEMIFEKDSLEENHIDSIDEIEFSLHIIERDSWGAIDDSQIYKVVDGGVQGFSATQNPNVQKTPGTNNDDIKVVINDKKVNFDVQPIIINGRTLVPMRAIFEELGASITWDGETQTVTSTKNNTNVSLSIGDNILHVNDMSKPLEVSAILLNGRTLVPVRAISEAFNCSVDWDGNTKTVIISDYN